MTDSAQYHFFGLILESQISRSRGNSFEDLFADIAGRVYGTDFIKIRAAGKTGDRKCDGYRRSTDTLYACYGPRDTTPQKLQKKIGEDFSGGKEQWAEMKAWCFVHNDTEGIDPDTFKLIQTLEKSNPNITFEYMGPLELKQLALSMPEKDLVDFLGPVPNAATLSRYGFPEISSVVDKVSQSASATDSKIVAPSKDKLQKNSFSPDIVALLKSGEVKAPAFRKFFADNSRILQGERIAAWFRQRFESLDDHQKESSEIFYTLLEDAGGLGSRPPNEQAAVLGLLSYLFHSCDIFKDP